MPLDELRSVVQRGDAALRRALKLATVTPRELDDLRTLCAQRRIALRKREAAEALRAGKEVVDHG